MVKNIGFLGLDDVDYKIDETAVQNQIKRTRSTCRFPNYWRALGSEYKATASDNQVALAHMFIDSGADFIWELIHTLLKTSKYITVKQFTIRWEAHFCI